LRICSSLALWPVRGQQLFSCACSTLQHTATHWSTLQHAVTHCNTQQHAATRWRKLLHTEGSLCGPSKSSDSCAACATHCNTLLCCVCNALQHTATHCNTLQHTATHCNTLQLTVTHYNSLPHCNALQRTAGSLTLWPIKEQRLFCYAWNKMQHTATHRNTTHNTLQHTATHWSAHCNTLQHTATHGRLTLWPVKEQWLLCCAWNGTDDEVAVGCEDTHTYYVELKTLAFRKRLDGRNFRKSTHDSIDYRKWLLSWLLRTNITKCYVMGREDIHT